jgi:hypothetical protein
MTDDDLAHARQALDPELMELFRYAVPRASSIANSLRPRFKYEQPRRRRRERRRKGSGGMQPESAATTS